MTTSNIPSSFNPDDLAKMLDQAVKEDEVKETDTTRDFSEETVTRIADEALDLATDKSSGPLVHKVMMVKIACQMIDWHSSMHDRIIQDGDDTHAALCWARDAGKFQAIMDILTSITVGPEDFITPIN